MTRFSEVEEVIQIPGIKVWMTSCFLCLCLIGSQAEPESEPVWARGVCKVGVASVGQSYSLRLAIIRSYIGPVSVSAEASDIRSTKT